jgi:peptidoglycan/xylan/chitin deacetylase (PgdA/CDA1 family)
MRHLAQQEYLDAATNGASPIALNFAGEIKEPIRSRIFYSFQVFAAIYNYRVAESDQSLDAIRCIYGGPTQSRRDPRTLHIPARYRMRGPGEPSPRVVKCRYAGENFNLFYGIDVLTGNPDWLGELFEWLSSSHEMQAAGRDSVGRIPYSESVFSQQKISPRKPHANLLMSWMQNVLRNGNSTETLPKAPSPVAGVQHFVVCSHDIDFYYSNLTSTLTRLIKNVGVSFSLYRNWSYFASNLGMLRDVLRGKRVSEYLPALLEASAKYGFQSTLFVVAQHGHRRDPNYNLRDITSRLHDAAKQGFEAAVHGSYLSVIEISNLAAEAAALEKALGTKVRGGRQHWLRFDTHEKLFECVESAGLVFDSTLGFSNIAGFRNGASFAFPPYNFLNERPHNFLEIPLALMDGNIEAAARTSGESSREIANEVLRESRKYGWGGISALWHNPIEPTSVPEEINQIFWECVSSQGEFQERWISAAQFLSYCLHRYQSAGLLTGVRLDA